MVDELEPGTPILVDGPHGSFRPPYPDAPYLLVGGGIGITPVMSICGSGSRPCPIVGNHALFPAHRRRPERRHRQRRRRVLDVRLPIGRPLPGVETSQPLEAAAVTCTARIVGGKTLRATGSLSGGRALAQCRFRLPVNARSKSVRGQVAVVYQSASARTPFTFRTVR